MVSRAQLLPDRNPEEQIFRKAQQKLEKKRQTEMVAFDDA